MANIRRIGGRSIALILLAICPPSDPAVSADLPIKTNHAAQPVRPVSRTCIGPTASHSVGIGPTRRLQPSDL